MLRCAVANRCIMIILFGVFIIFDATTVVFNSATARKFFGVIATAFTFGFVVTAAVVTGLGFFLHYNRLLDIYKKKLLDVF